MGAPPPARRGADGRGDSGMSFLLMTSSDTSDEAMERLARLVASTEQRGVHGAQVVVARGDGWADLPESNSLRLHGVTVPFDTSLARARNVAIDYAREQGLLDRADVVGFPDDDCEYVDGALPRVAELLATGDALACVPYAPAPDRVHRRRFPARDMPMTPLLAMQAGSCAGIFLPGWALNVIGDFDERYGLGAPFGASEDTDYVLRALGLGLPCCYYGREALVLHPYKRERPSQYYLGNVAALSKHARGGGTGYLLLRRLGQGALLAAVRRIAWREYVQAVRTALELLRWDAIQRLPTARARAARTSRLVTYAPAIGRSGPSPRTSAPER